MNGVLIGWIILSVVVGLVASGQNRNGIAFFVLSLLLSPLVSLVVLLSIGSKETTANTKEVNHAQSETKVCPFCAELVKREAIYCKHCNKDLEKSPLSSVVSKSASIHKELQNAIYDKDVNKVKKLLSSVVSEKENPLAFSHNEYAEAYGNEEIIDLVRKAVD